MWLVQVALSIVTTLGEEPRMLLTNDLFSPILLAIIDAVACIFMLYGIQILRSWSIENKSHGIHLVSLIWLGLASFLTLLTMTTGIIVLAHAVYWRVTN